MKSPVRSRTLWTSVPGSALFLVDALAQFVQSGSLHNACAQKSALAGALLAAVAVLRFKTTQPIFAQGGPVDDRRNPKAPD